MKVKQKAKRVVSGLLTAVTLLSTVLSPISSYAAELPKERKLPLLEEVQSQLDEDEIVLAKDHQVEVGTSFDVKTDFTGLEIKDATKVKITFEEAKNEQGEDFTTSHADTYKTVYQVEPVNQEHPNYQISRNVVVKEIEKESESPSADAEQSETKETEEDAEDSEKPSEIPTETPDVSEGNAAFDALVEQMTEQDTFMFFTWLSATVFHILSGIICITAILGYGFGQETGTEAIRMLAIGFILYVLPILAGWSVVWLEAIKIRLMGD